MKKLIFLILLSSVAFAQSGNPLADSLTALRSSITLNKDSLTAHNLRIIEHNDSLVIHRDSVEAISTRSRLSQDSLTAHNLRILAHNDSLVVYRDSVEALSTRSKASEDSVEAISTRTIALEAEDVTINTAVDSLRQGLTPGLHRDSWKFNIPNPQMNEYWGFYVEDDITIDSIYASVDTDESGTDEQYFNLWHYPYYISGVANYVFASTMKVDNEWNSTPEKWYVADFSDYTVDKGDFFWLQISTVVGDIDKLYMTIYFTRIYSAE